MEKIKYSPTAVVFNDYLIKGDNVSLELFAEKIEGSERTNRVIMIIKYPDGEVANVTCNHDRKPIGVNDIVDIKASLHYSPYNLFLKRAEDIGQVILEDPLITETIEEIVKNLETNINSG